MPQRTDREIADAILHPNGTWGGSRRAAWFPASAIPVLAAFADCAYVEPIEGDRNHVTLLALDPYGSNAIHLTLEGSCPEVGFGFRIPAELVEACRRRPPVAAWCEGEQYKIPVPAWQTPGSVMLLGRHYEPDPNGLTSLSAFVGPQEPIPQFEDAALAAVDLAFAPTTPLELPKPGPRSADDDEEVIAGSAFAKLAVLQTEMWELLGDGVSIRQADKCHVWRLGEIGTAWTAFQRQQRDER